MACLSSHAFSRPLTCAFAGLLALTGCDDTTQADIRERLDRWVSVGPATYYEARQDCNRRRL